MFKTAWLEALLGLRCPGCGAPLDQPTLCKACAAELVPRYLPNWVYLGSYARFGGLSRGIKYRGHRELAVWVGHQLGRGVRQVGWPIEAVTAVPTLYYRQAQRGYNPAELIARAVAQELGVPYRAALSRVRYSKSQTRKTLLQRLELPQDTFAPRAPLGGHWLLVDDVVTTGTTFSRAKAALLGAGAARVYGAAIAIKSPYQLSRFSL